jgi:RNA polymerase sigma-70 factor (ECF subfamily)
MERPGFDSTIWSDVLHARGRTDAERREALDRLCRAYWEPLHAWLRRRGVPPQDAEDSVQGFLAHFIEKALVDRADPARGRFRNYLLKTFEHWLSNERRIAGAAKRGGGRPPAPLSVQPPDLETPEDAFNRSWALTVLGRAQEQLKKELHEKGLGVHYAAFCACLSGSDDRPSHEEMAQKLGCAPADVAALLYASRRRLGELVRSVLRDTVDTGSDVENEVSELFKFLLRKRPHLTS